MNDLTRRQPLGGAPSELLLETYLPGAAWAAQPAVRRNRETWR